MEASACAEETPGVAGAIPYLAARNRNMKKIALIIFFALQAAFAHAAAFDQSAWDALLKKHVSALRNGQATQVDYAEPRIHFAVNCASIGCPALRPEAYVGERLDAQLEDAARSFLSDRTRNRLEGNALKVSSIFKWYRGDFEKGWRGASNLAGFFVIYRQPLDLDDGSVSRLKAGKMDIDFLDYDWRLNSKASRAP